MDVLNKPLCGPLPSLLKYVSVFHKALWDWFSLVSVAAMLVHKIIYEHSIREMTNLHFEGSRCTLRSPHTAGQVVCPAKRKHKKAASSAIMKSSYIT